MDNNHRISDRIFVFGLILFVATLPVVISSGIGYSVGALVQFITGTDGKWPLIFALVWGTLTFIGITCVILNVDDN